MQDSEADRSAEESLGAKTLNFRQASIQTPNPWLSVINAGYINKRTDSNNFSSQERV
jgi:hypothetical protein